MAREGLRLERVGEQIRHALSEELMRAHFRDPDLQNVTVAITQVRPSPDLRHARVFVQPIQLGKTKNHESNKDINNLERDKILQALNRASGYLQSRIASHLSSRSLPKLNFFAETTFDTSGRIDQLLNDPKVLQDINRSDDA